MGGWTVENFATHMHDEGFREGFSRQALRRINDEARPKEKLDAIAFACRLPPEWFEVDFQRLPEIAGPPQQTALSQLGEMRGQLREQLREIRQLGSTVALLQAKVTELARQSLQPSTGTGIAKPHRSPR
jgi:hypothetical protein